MRRTITSNTHRRSAAAASEITLADALSRVDNPRLASSLSVFYAELARAQADGDQEAIQYVRSAIAEAMRGVPDGEIDMPLIPPRCKSRKKSQR